MAVVLGVIIGSVMTASFVYVALRLGFSLPGSTVAAILGFAVLRGLLRQGTIVENNINQTVASGVNNASAGIAFTLPALFILAHEDAGLRNFQLMPLMLSALGGSFLGVAFIIPLRKQMIEFERLRFPSGIAVASLLRSPGAGMRQAQLLVAGFGVAALFHTLTGVGVLAEELDLGTWIGLPAYFPVAVGVSFASLGAGLLSGRGGLSFAFGGMLAWWVIVPVAVLLRWVPSASEIGPEISSAAHASFVAGELAHGQMLRPLGIGVLIGGALSGVLASLPSLRAAFRALLATSRRPGGGSDLSPRILYAGVAAAFVLLFAAALSASSAEGEIGIPRALLIATVGTLWLGLAGLVVAQATGMTDISPISGMSLIGVTVMFFLSGGDVTASIVLGIAVSIGIGQCADMMTDLKSGHLVGAEPRRQQLAQLAVSWVGVPVAVATVYLLWGSFDQPGFGPTAPQLSAPQGSALAGVIQSLGAGAAPLDKYVAGGAIGMALGIVPIRGLGVLIGLAMYLPFYITLTYGVGCFLAMAVRAARGDRWVADTLVPVAAGFIIGEALTSLITALAQLAST